MIARFSDAKVSRARQLGRVPSERDVAERDRAELELCEIFSAEVTRPSILRRLRSYEPPEPPIRSARLPADDEDLLDKVREAKRRSRPNADQKDLLGRFGRWRSACINVEAEGEGRLLVILSAIWRADVAGDDETVFELRRFLANKWDRRLDEIPHGYGAVALAASRMARRHDVISDVLLLERKAPPRSPARREPEQADFDDLVGMV